MRKIFRILLVVFSFIFISFNGNADKQQLPFNNVNTEGLADSFEKGNISRSEYERYLDDFVVDGIYKYYNWNKGDFEVSTQNTYKTFEELADIRIGQTFMNLPGQQPAIDKFMNPKLLLTRILPIGVIVLLILISFIKKDKIKQDDSACSIKVNSI